MTRTMIETAEMMLNSASAAAGNLIQRPQSGPGYMTDETQEISYIPGKQVSMGFYPVGPKCYREIMRMCRESNNTMEVTL